MNKPFNVDSHVRTRDGREARIFMVDAGGHQPIIGAVKERDGDYWEMVRWWRSGAYRRGEIESPLDLIHVPETRTMAVKIYLMEDGVVIAHPAAFDPYISESFGSQTVELTFERGRHG